MNKHPRPLKQLLLIHELIFVLLVLLAGASGWAGIRIWQDASGESQRINTLVQEVQQTRGDLYRQMKELFDAIFLRDPLALEEYATFSRNAEQHFLQLRSYASGPQELQAIGELQRSYEGFQAATQLLLEQRDTLSPEQLRQRLNTDLESSIFSRYEAAAGQTESLLAAKQHQLQQQLQQSKRTALMLMTLPVLLAGALLLFSRLFLQRAIVRPIDDVVLATAEISAGRLEHRAPSAGIAELSTLAHAINQMADELKLNREALIRSEKQAAQGALVPMLAHNIRNPLASIRAIAQVAESPETDQETRHALHDIIGTVDRLERWTGALLAYLLPMKPTLVPTSLQNVLHGAITPLRTRLREKSVSIDMPAEAAGITLTADGNLLEQALYNLLLNAIDASPARSSITIALESTPAMIMLRILDRGPGMPFTPDPGNLSPGPSTKRFGTGLGIPFSFKVCDALGYKLAFSARAGGGTVASLAIPRTT